MSLQVEKILGIRITISSKNDILEEIRKYIITKNQEPRTKNFDKQKPLIIFTPNPEIINYAQKDDNFKQIVNTAQINLPDGVGVVWALKKLFGIKLTRIAGIDLMEDLVNFANKESLTIGLIGGRRGVAVATRECLLRKHQNLKVEVFEAPEVETTNYKLSFDFAQDRQITNKYKIQNSKKESDKDTSGGGSPSADGHDSSEVEEKKNNYLTGLTKELIAKKITILFVALGFPKQEYFIAQLARTLNQEQKAKNIEPRTENEEQKSSKFEVLSSKFRIPIILMSVGGAFDYISGRIPRAPKFIRNLGLEWLYRLIREPWRIKRQLAGAAFFWKVLTNPY